MDTAREIDFLFSTIMMGVVKGLLQKSLTYFTCKYRVNICVYRYRYAFHLEKSFCISWALLCCVSREREIEAVSEGAKRFQHFMLPEVERC